MNSFDKTKNFCFDLPHRRSTTVSLETRNPYAFATSMRVLDLAQIDRVEKFSLDSRDSQVFHTYVLPLENHLVDRLPCGFCPVHQ